nr:RNA-directed DNA polymerase, eukaryota, reverse transcriptase zinc-binding domain protein [Tanacetum cinerariifolium]
ELLVYVRDTCPNAINLSAKKVTVTPKNNVKKVRFVKPIISSNNIKRVESSKIFDSNTHVLSPTGLKCSTSNFISKPTCNKKNDRISKTPSRSMKNKVEAQPRNVNKKNRIVEPTHKVDVKQSQLNANSKLICATCKKSMFDGVHDMCLLDFVNNVKSGAKSAKKHKKQNIWKPMVHVFTKVGFKWKPTGKTFTIVGNSCPLPRIISANVRFLRSKDEAPEDIIKCVKNIQVRLNTKVHNVRTDNGTEFFNQTLHEFYENVRISYQTPVARSPQQNGVVERRNQTLVEASHSIECSCSCVDGILVDGASWLIDVDTGELTKSTALGAASTGTGETALDGGLKYSSNIGASSFDLKNLTYEVGFLGGTTLAEMILGFDMQLLVEHFNPVGDNTCVLESDILDDSTRLMLIEDMIDKPMVEKSKLDEDLKGKSVDATLYHSMIGSLMYLASSRPDLIYAVCLCAGQHGRMILESVENGLLIWPTIEDNGLTRPQKYFELTPVETIQANGDGKATNIILQDLISHCKIRVGNGMRTQFWNDTWVGDTQPRYMFTCIYALDVNKVCTVADKLQGSVALSLQCKVRGGVEAHQLDLL